MLEYDRAKSLENIAAKIRAIKRRGLSRADYAVNRFLRSTDDRMSYDERSHYRKDVQRARSFCNGENEKLTRVRTYLDSYKLKIIILTF